MQATEVRVTAFVRCRGAIGIFYEKEFDIVVYNYNNIEQVYDAWFEQAGQEYELHHFIAVGG